MRPSWSQALILFSPAVVLVVWAARVSVQDGWMTNTEVVAFMITLAISVIAAEMVRMHLRVHKHRRHHHRSRHER